MDVGKTISPERFFFRGLSAEKLAISQIGIEWCNDIL